MKNYQKFVLVMLLIPGSLLTSNVFGDPPPDPPPLPSGGHGSGNNEPPAGAPIDGGLGILIILGTAVGWVKLYSAKAGERGN